MKKLTIYIMLLLVLLPQCAGCSNTTKAELYVISHMQLYTPYQPDNTVDLSDELVNYFETLWNDAEWEPDTTKTACDYVFVYDNTTIRYVADSGLFNDVDNNRHCYISESQRDHVNSLLSDILKLPVT